MFSQDGALLITAEGSNRSILRLWDVQSGKQIGPQLTGHRHLVDGMVLWPDAGTLATASRDGAGALTLWDLASQKELLGLQAETARFGVPRFSADGCLLGCLSTRNVLYLWRAPSWAELEAAQRTKL